MKEIFSFKEKLFLWQKIISVYRKSFHLIGTNNIWQEMISSDRKAFPLTEKHFLWQETIYFDTNSFSWLWNNSFDGKFFFLIKDGYGKEKEAQSESLKQTFIYVFLKIIHGLFRTVSDLEEYPQYHPMTTHTKSMHCSDKY